MRKEERFGTWWEIGLLMIWLVPSEQRAVVADCAEDRLMPMKEKAAAARSHVAGPCHYCRPVRPDADGLFFRQFGADVIWWGWRDWRKWRWNVTDIELGPFTVYRLKRTWFWSWIGALIWPMGRAYHIWFHYRLGLEAARAMCPGCVRRILHQKGFD